MNESRRASSAAPAGTAAAKRKKAASKKLAPVTERPVEKAVVNVTEKAV